MTHAQSIGRNLKSALVDKVLDGIRFGYQRHPRYKTLFEEQFYNFKDAWIARLGTDDWISQLDAFYFELSQFMHGKLLLIYDEMESIWVKKC